MQVAVIIPLLAARDREVGELALGFEQLVDALLEGARRNESVDQHVLRLADAERAVRGLILGGRIPPEVVMDHDVRGRQVEADAARLEREDHHAAVGVVLEAVDHLLALGQIRRK